MKNCPKFLIFFLLLTGCYLLVPSPAWAAASLSFSPASKTVGLNETFSVNVILNTGGSETDATDAIINYDNYKLEVVSATLGSLYANKLSEDTSTAGKVIFRATSTSDQSYNGTGTFATISFRTIAEGTANVYFQFTSGSTTDCNVAYQGSDLLGSVSNASYTVSSSSTTSSPAPASSTTTGTGGTTSAPVSGSTSPTIFLLGGGLLLVFLGGLKMAFFKG